MCVISDNRNNRVTGEGPGVGTSGERGPRGSAGSGGRGSAGSGGRGSGGSGGIGGLKSAALGSGVIEVPLPEQAVQKVRFAVCDKRSQKFPVFLFLRC